MLKVSSEIAFSPFSEFIYLNRSQSVQDAMREADIGKTQQLLNPANIWQLFPDRFNLKPDRFSYNLLLLDYYQDYLLS